MSGPVKINFISDQDEEAEKPNPVNSHSIKPSVNPADTTDKPKTAQKNATCFLVKPKKGSRIKKILASFVIIIIIAFAVFSSSIIFSNENLIKGFTNLNFLGQVGNLIVSSDKPLKGEQNDRINFLLLGIGGNNHDGGNLTDTMILGTLKPSTNQIAMMSIPRDLYVKSTSSGWEKINAVNAYAEAKKPGSGGEATREFLSNLLGTEIDYYAVIDFDGFEKLIDEFGGVDVYVDNDLIDYSYPILNREDAYPIASRFETLNIKKGWQHFDGATALKYTRSRHALGPEGSDFARSKRQQKVLIALKNKIAQYNYLLDPSKIASLISAYGKNVSTNMQIWEMLKLAKLAKNADTEHPINYSLVEGHAPLLYDQIVNGAYVLLPYGGNYDKIKFVWQNIFTMGTSSVPIDYTKWAEFKDQPTSTKSTSTSAIITAATTTEKIVATATAPFSNDPAPVVPSLKPAVAKEASYQAEGARIEIQNGTAVEGWASSEAKKLKAKGFTIVKTGNATQKNYTSIKIYDFSGGKYLLTTSELQILYGVSATPPPAGLKSSADIVIILGK